MNSPKTRLTESGDRPLLEKSQSFSILEFVAWEQNQTQRHELIGGKVVAFLDASMDHETIAINVIVHLRASLQPPCKVFGSASLVETISRVGSDCYRPDVTVSRSAAAVGSRLYVTEPRIVVEVVSPSNSTSNKDWRTKLFEYWNTPSIEQVVLIESLERYATSYNRNADGTWMPETAMTSGVLGFPTLSIGMEFQKIYEQTSLA